MPQGHPSPRAQLLRPRESTDLPDLGYEYRRQHRADPGNLLDGVVAGIADRRGAAARNIGKVAAARKLLTLVFYGLRDGEIRALAQPRQTIG
jgi:hypothetical protein